MDIKNILVPVDFSDCSKNALRIAIDISKRAGAKIHMVNAVFVHLPYPDITGGSLIQTLISDYENQVKDAFKELESELIELKEVPTSTSQFISVLVDAIYTETKNKAINLIVMGTRAERPQVEQFVGSHASEVIKSSQVPVLVIPENTSEFNPKKIGFAVDFKVMQNPRNLQIINTMAQLYQAEVMVFHVTDDLKSISNQTHKSMNDIVAKFEGVGSSVRTIEADSVVEGIQKFSNSHQLDLLIAVPQEQTFLKVLLNKSVTKKIAQNLEIPLLTIQQF